MTVCNSHRMPSAFFLAHQFAVNEIRIVTTRVVTVGPVAQPTTVHVFKADLAASAIVTVRQSVRQLSLSRFCWRHIWH